MSKRAIHICCLCMAVALLSGCGDNLKSLDIKKWEITLKKDDKKPYGTYLAYHSLKSFFPGAKVIDLSPSYRFASIDYNMQNSASSGRNLMILSGLSLGVSDKEWDKLKLFVRNGNELVIFCSRIDEKIQTTLGFNFISGNEEYRLYDRMMLSSNEGLLRLAANPTKKYGYTGRSLAGCFSKIATNTDTAYTEDNYESSYTIADTISYANSVPDCIRIAMGRGHITIHAAPLVLSNYFLLQDGNIDYLTGIWQSLPDDIDNIYWNDYFKHSSSDNTPWVLFQHPATRWAIILSMVTFAVYILFQMKRRQRIIPVIPPLRNDSVSFVETVGRLYFNKGDHNNLSEKMVQQFLEWVRTKYYLNTNLLNEDFTKHLAMKSGQPIATVTELTTMIHDIRLRSVKADDAYLYQLYRTIQQFYQNHHK